MSTLDRDRLIHEPNRYRFLLLVAQAPSGILLTDLADRLGSNADAIGHHGIVLAKAGLVRSQRVWAGKIGRVWYWRTPQGLRVLADLRAELSSVPEVQLAS